MPPPRQPALRPLLLPLGLALSLAAAARAEEPQRPAPPPDEGAQRLLERELGPLPAVEFTTPGGARGKVEAAAPVELAAAEEGAERLTVRLGTGEPVTCTLGRGRFDAGASVAALVQSAGRTLEVVAVRPVEVSVEAGEVVLFAEIRYRPPAGQGPPAGHLKVAVHPHPTHSLLCVHDEPGYSATFRRVVKGLAASLADGAPDDRARARFAEVQVAEVAGQPAGYVERQIWEGAGGARTAITREALLLSRSPRELTGIDEYTVEESDGAGLLTGAHAVRAVDGALELDVKLAPGDAPRTFAYQGRRAGKDLAGTFAAREGLATELWFARRLSGQGRPAARLVHGIWSAGADPASPTRLTYARDPRARGGAAFTVGPMTVKGELDEHGLMKDLEIPMGPAVLTVRRVWSRGSP